MPPMCTSSRPKWVSMLSFSLLAILLLPTNGQLGIPPPLGNCPPETELLYYTNWTASSSPYDVEFGQTRGSDPIFIGVHRESSVTMLGPVGQFRETDYDPISVTFSDLPATTSLYWIMDVHGVGTLDGEVSPFEEQVSISRATARGDMEQVFLTSLSMTLDAPYCFPRPYPCGNETSSNNVPNYEFRFWDDPLDFKFDLSRMRVNFTVDGDELPSRSLTIEIEGINFQIETDERLGLGQIQLCGVVEGEFPPEEEEGEDDPGDGSSDDEPLLFGLSPVQLAGAGGGVLVLGSIVVVMRRGGSSGSDGLSSGKVGSVKSAKSVKSIQSEQGTPPSYSPQPTSGDTPRESMGFYKSVSLQSAPAALGGAPKPRNKSLSKGKGRGGGRSGARKGGRGGMAGPVKTTPIAQWTNGRDSDIVSTSSSMAPDIRSIR